MEYKKLILPVGSKVYTDEPCNIKWEWTCRLKNMPASDKISEIRFPEGTTWAGFPIGSISPYYNRAYKGFEFSHYFEQRFSWFYADHMPSARWLNEYVRYSLESFDTVDNEDWRFNPANLKFPADANHININVKQRLRTDLDKLPVQGLACCDVSTRKHSDGSKADQWQ
ncbi:hypothetical protein [Neisseria sp. CCUG12390]|uniref:hypothetical protein n=1 Tax=Neisseria sp. CCUG12390 TaxID=3392035 RepID=UPI003A0FEA44